MDLSIYFNLFKVLMVTWAHNELLKLKLVKRGLHLSNHIMCSLPLNRIKSFWGVFVQLEDFVIYEFSFSQKRGILHQIKILSIEGNVSHQKAEKRTAQKIRTNFLSIIDSFRHTNASSNFKQNS